MDSRIKADAAIPALKFIKVIFVFRVFDIKCPAPAHRAFCFSHDRPPFFKIAYHAHRTWFDEAPSNQGAKIICDSYRLQFKIMGLAALKRYECRTPNVQCRILNKVFCLFKKWRSEAIPYFDIQHSLFDIRYSKNVLICRYCLYLFSPER